MQIFIPAIGSSSSNSSTTSSSCCSGGTSSSSSGGRRGRRGSGSSWSSSSSPTAITTSAITSTSTSTSTTASSAPDSRPTTYARAAHRHEHHHHHFNYTRSALLVAVAAATTLLLVASAQLTTAVHTYHNVPREVWPTICTIHDKLCLALIDSPTWEDFSCQQRPSLHEFDVHCGASPESLRYFANRNLFNSLTYWALQRPQGIRDYRNGFRNAECKWGCLFGSHSVHCVVSRCVLYPSCRCGCRCRWWSIVAYCSRSFIPFCERLLEEQGRNAMINCVPSRNDAMMVDFLVCGTVGADYSKAVTSALKEYFSRR